MPALGAAVEALAVQDVVHVAGARPCPEPECLFPAIGERHGILAPALEARPVSCGERRHLVEEEQLGVGAPPDVAVPLLEFEHAADPGPRDPAPPCQSLCIGVKAP